MINVKCPSCGQLLALPDTVSGQVQKCPSCGNPMAIPIAVPTEQIPPAQTPGRRKPVRGPWHSLGIWSGLLGLAAIIGVASKDWNAISLALGLLGAVSGIAAVVLATAHGDSRLGGHIFGTLLSVLALVWMHALPPWQGPFENLLYDAAKRGDVSTVRNLARRVSNIDQVEFFGGTPLQVAIQSGHSDVAELLIAKGANVNAGCLQAAVGRRDRAMVELLIAKGADVNRAESALLGGPVTPLQRAEQVGDSDIIRVLVSHGAR